MDKKIEEMKSEREICEYLLEKIIPEYKKIFKKEFPNVEYLIAVLVRGLTEKMKGESKESEKKTVSSIVTGVIKFHETASQSLEKKQKDHSLSLLVFVRATVHKKQGHYKDAIIDLTKAMELFPDPHYIRQRAAIFMTIQDFKKAFEDFRVVNQKVEKTVDKFHSIINMSECLLGLHDYRASNKLMTEQISSLGSKEEFEKKYSPSIHSNQLNSHWAFSTKFYLQRAKGFLVMSLFEEAISDYNFVTEMFITYYNRKETIGYLSFCEEIMEHFDDHPNYREFFLGYILNHKNKDVKKILPSIFSKEEIKQKFQYLQEKKKKTDILASNRKEDQEKDSDPLNTTKQLVLIKNGMADHVMRESRDFPERILFVLSQILLEDLTWTNPTLKYWSCSILDFQDRMILDTSFMEKKNKNNKKKKKKKKGRNLFHQQTASNHLSYFYDPGRTSSILPLDYYQFMKISSSQKHVREVFLLDPSGDHHLFKFLNRVLHYNAKDPLDEMKHLVRQVRDSMGGKVEDMTKLNASEIKKFQDEHKSLFGGYSPELVLQFVVQQHMDKFVRSKQRFVVTFGDMIHNKIEGVCRHRAILFKLCCDVRNIPCRLVRGYVEVDGKKVGEKRRLQHAWNVVRVNGRLHVVDLMNGGNELIPWTHPIADLYRTTGGSTNNNSTLATVTQTRRRDLLMGKSLWEKKGRFSVAQKKRIPSYSPESNEKNQKKNKKQNKLEGMVIMKKINLKSVEKYFGTDHQRYNEFIESKRYLMKYLTHTNLVNCAMGERVSSEFHTLTQFYQLNGREFVEYLKRSEQHMDKPIRFREVLILLISVLKGLRFLNRNGLVHQNLKLENLLINLNEVGLIRDVCISDYYLSGFQQFIYLRENKDRLSMLKELDHVPLLQPNLVDDEKKYFEDKTFDIYSFGIIARHFLENLHPSAVDTCKQCLSHNPSERPSLASLLRVLEGSLLKEYHMLGGPNHGQRRIGYLKEQIEKHRLDVKEFKVKYEALKLDSIQVSNELKKKTSFLESKLDEEKKQNLMLMEKIKLLENKLDSAKAEAESSSKLKNINIREEEVEKIVNERVEKETETLRFAIRSFREGLEKKYQKQLDEKDRIIRELRKALHSSLQK